MSGTTEISADERKKFTAELNALKAVHQALEKKLKAVKPMTFLFTGLVKEYMDAVKKSGGLTSAKPSCTTALQKAEKNATTANLSAAVKAIEAHEAEVIKAAKGKKDQEKQAAAFSKAVSSLTANIEKVG